MFTPIGFAPGVPAEYYESIGQQSLADRLREAQAASNPVAPLSNADLLASASRAASSPVVSGALSSVSTTPTFNPADYGPPSQVVSAPIVDENKVIQDYVNATMASNPNDWVNIVAQRMDEVGVSPSRLQQAFPDLSVEQIQQSYEEARPTGKYSTPAETITINKDFTPAPLSNVETLNINPYLYTVKPTTTFDAGEFVGPVAPGSPKSSPTTATDLTFTPSFLTQVQAEEDVRQAFDRVLGRQPFAGPGSGLEYWTNELVKGNVTLADLDQAIAFGAQGDDRLAANKFLGTDYFKVADSTTATNLTSPFSKRTQAEEDVRQAFQRVLGRDPGSQLDFWTNELVNGGVTLANLDSLLRSTETPKPETKYNDWAESLEKPLFNSYDEVIEQINKETPAGYLTSFGLGRGWDLGVVPEKAKKEVLGGDNQFPELEQFGGTLTNDQLKKLFVDSTGVSSPDALYAWYSDDWGSNDVLDLNVYDIMQEKGSNPDQGIFATDQFLSNNLKDLQENFGIDEATLKIALNKVVAEKGSEYIGNSAVYNVHGIIADTARTSLASLGRLDADTEAQLNDFTKVGEDALQERLRIIEELNKRKDNGLGFVLAVGTAFFAPYLGPQIGAAMGFTGATAAAAGAGVLSVSTQLAVNGKIDPGSLLLSMGGAYVGTTGNLTGSDIAVDAATMAEVGQGSAQIAENLMFNGVNPVTANLAGTFASAGVAVEIAPMITSGIQNMGLTALATSELNADALTKSFLTGASGEASSLAVDKVIGAENLKLIADATGLTQDQAGSIATSALINGMNAEILDADKSFLDAVTETLVVSGVSTVTANKVATALDDMTSSKGRAAIVGATKNIMDVAGTAAWNDMDVGDALEAMAPTLIGNAIATYVRTPDIAKTDDKDKTVEAPVAATKQLSESEIANQLEENLIFDGRQATSQEQAATQARNSGFNTFIYDNKTYTISPDAKPIDLSESRIRQDLDEGLLYDGRDAKSLNDAAQLARNEGFNTFIYGDKTYTIPSQAELRENANLEISKQTTFGSAFSKARELLGPGQTFDWQGKSYSTATAEERPDLAKAPGDVTQTDTGAAFHMNIGRKYTDAEMNILNASLADIGKNAAQIPTSEMDFVTAAATGKEVGVVGDKISADIVAPFVTTLGTLTRGGAGITEYTRGTLEALEVIDSKSPLAKGMKDMADAMNKTANFQIGDWALNQEQQFIQKVQNADGALNKAAALAQAIYDHPSAVLTLSGSEIMEEIPSIAAMLATGGTTAVARFLSLGAGALLNGMESGGQAYNEAKQLALDAGLSEDAAHTKAQYAAAGAAAVGAVLQTFAEAPLVRGLTAGKGVVSTSVKREMATEFPEEFAQTGMTDYFGSGKFDANNALSNAFIALPIAGNTAGVMATGVNLSQSGNSVGEIVAANTNNSFEVQQEVNNILGSSNNIQEASQSIVSSLTDMGMNPGAAVAVANTVAAEQVVNNINSQLTEDSKFSLNALNSQVGISSEGEPVTLGEYIGSSTTNLGPNVFVSPDVVIGTKNDGSLLTVADISGSINMDIARGGVTAEPTIEVDPNTGIKTDIKVDPNTGSEVTVTNETNPETGIETKTETAVNPDTNIATEIKTETNSDTNVTTKTETNVNPDTNTAVEVKTETNPDQNTETNTVTNNETNIQTEIKVDNNTVVATEINLDTNIKTDITTNIDKIIEDLVDTGVKPEDALKIAVEEVKEDAKSTKKDQTGLATTKKAEGIGGVPMFMSTPYEETDFEHQSLYTKGKVKPFEGVLDEFMKRFESEPSAPDQMTTKPESKMDSDYFVYGSQTDIDDVLSQTPPNTIPSLNVPAFGMRSGGLVPPFAGGGPLTMAAGKLRKDYRQGDAVEGPGDGQSDDIPAMLADGEFVIPADVVAALGNGSNKAGADKLYDMMHNIRRQARKGDPKDLPKPAKSPLQYITRR
jgi:hypothetical protein